MTTNFWFIWYMHELLSWTFVNLIWLNSRNTVKIIISVISLTAH